MQNPRAYHLLTPELVGPHNKLDIFLLTILDDIMISIASETDKP
jgi:hypothetical protein